MGVKASTRTEVRIGRCFFSSDTADLALTQGNYMAPGPLKKNPDLLRDAASPGAPGGAFNFSKRLYHQWEKE